MTHMQYYVCWGRRGLQKFVFDRFAADWKDEEAYNNNNNVLMGIND